MTVITCDVRFLPRLPFFPVVIHTEFSLRLCERACRGRSFAQRDDVRITIAVDVSNRDTAGWEVAGQTLAHFGKTSLAGTEHHENALQVHSERDGHVAIRM